MTPPRHHVPRPIAVVGAACRLPGGVAGLDGLWTALHEGRDLVGRVPEDRFDADLFVDQALPRAGKSYTAAGGFLDNVTDFDAGYFGISPKEAAHMDPQHRLLLELASETLDDAAIAPQALAGGDTAVYVGISDTSYGALQMLQPRSVGPYTISGAASSIAANRLSHAFDLRGPSMAVDTACSSSLIALDLACRALWAGTSRTALCGGANILLSPFIFIGFSQAAMLSRRGVCASFSADADGFVRAEGGGMVLLKPLDDALADGDRVLGLILGTAGNCDGRTMGIALPDAAAQEDLLRRVYADFGVRPDELVYFEAHGTGTPVGDPVEAQAIGRALGMRRITGELPIGSVKTNLGHLEPASGMAGLCKALLVLRHRVAPASLHAEHPHPDIDLPGLGLDLVRENRPLPPSAGRAVVGVNSFGFGGANAHAIVAAAPPEADRPAGPAPMPAEGLPVLVSGRTPQALAEAAARMSAHLSGLTPHPAHPAGTEPADAAEPATPEPAADALDEPPAVERAAERAAVADEPAAPEPAAGPAADEPATPEAAADAAEPAAPEPAATPEPAAGPAADEPGVPGQDLPAQDFYDAAYTACRRRGLHEHRAAVLARTPAEAARLLAEVADGRRPAPGPAVAAGRVAFVFAGNGSPWAGMAADLLAREPVFRETVAALDAELAPHLGWSVADLLAAPARTWRLAATDVAQPLLFAVQVGIVEVLRARGVRPDMVTGHSAGELAAAYAAGALTLAQAARLVAVRSGTQARTAGSGRMAAVGLGEAEMAGELRGRPGWLEIAGVNGPQDVTLAGDPAALAELGARLTGRGVFFRELDLDYAFHSRAMDPLREPLLAGLAGLEPGPATAAFYSTVTGTPLDGEDLDAEYWWRNVRQPVRFGDAVEHLLEDGADVFLEIGPHPVLRSYLRRAAERRPRTTVAVLPTLRRGCDGQDAVAEARAALLAVGARTDWDRYFPYRGRAVALPGYPWQRERHWGGGKDLWTGTGRREHPLLGARAESPTPLWISAVEPAIVPWLTGHRVGGAVLVPATAFVEMSLAAGRAVLGTRVEMEYLDIVKGLVVPWEDASGTRVQTSFSPDDGVVVVSSGDALTAGTHTRARVRTLVRGRPAPVDLDAWREGCAERIEPDRFYAACDEVGLRYGADFRVLGTLSRGPGRALAGYAHAAPADPYTVHPALLDGALQTGVTLLLDRLGDGLAYLPSAIRAVRVWDDLTPTGFFAVRERSAGREAAGGRAAAGGNEEVCWDILVTDPEGNVTAQLEGCRLRRFAGGLRRAPAVTHTVLRAAPRPAQPAEPSPLPGPAEVVDRCGADLDRLRAGWHALHHERFAPLVRAHYLAAFAAVLAGALPEPADPFTADDLVAGGLDAQRYRRLERLAAPGLVAHGFAERLPDGRLRLTGAHRPAADGGARGNAWEIVDSSPAHSVELALATHQAQRLDGLLRGTEDPLDLLVDDSSGTVLQQFYDLAPYCRFHNLVARSLVGELVRCWPADRPLRVLEVGAGTGGTTAALLPVLPADRTVYHFTDTSAYFLPRAQARFRPYDFVTYGTFDLDADPAGQGFGGHRFDLVVAGNALHTARHLPKALERLAALLVPGGQLLAVEPHTEDLLLPIFGTLDSLYTREDTDVRPESPLLARDRWPDLLRRHGFARVAQTGDDRPPVRDGSSVILAATPSAAPGDPRGGPAPAPATRADPADRAAGPDSPEGPDGPPGWTRHVVFGEPGADGPGEDGGTLPLAEATVKALADAGCPAVGPLPLGASAPDLAGVLAGALGADPATAAGGAREPGQPAVVVLLGAARTAEPAAVVRRVADQLAAVRDLVAACQELPPAVRPELWLVTGPNPALTGILGPDGDPDRESAGAQDGDQDGAAYAEARAAAGGSGDPVPPTAAALWGAARCLANEHPEPRTRRIALTPGADPAADARRLVAELADPGAEDEIVLTRRGRFVPRELSRPPALPAAPETVFRLHVDNPGLSYRLSWREAPPLEPGPGQVLLRVSAAALNYRDLMQVVGLLPGEVFEDTLDGAGRGLEGVGVVLARGSGVEHLRPGDRVAGFAPAFLASHTVADADQVWRIPDEFEMTAPAAASLPVACATVQYALGTLVRLRPGETVLVHGGAGGVGLAAARYAAAHGARVIATAGGGVKRSLLRGLGVEHVLDSRTLEFAERIREITGGRGVDVVLNSLAGEAMARSLELLRPGGRFVELGKRDLFENKPLLLRPFLNNIAYFGMDLSKVLTDADEARELLGEVAEAAARGGFTPLPHLVFPAARVADAFQLLQHSRHIGKIVVSFDRASADPASADSASFDPSSAGSFGEPPLVEPLRRGPRLDPDGSYLVTGGTSGFGAATAGWLADRGARHIALVSRRGPAAPEADAVLAGLRRRGVTATAYAADVTDLAGMREVVARIDAGGHPLRGVVHGAMHLDDDGFLDLDTERTSAVLAPKIAGAEVLDALTRDRPCDLFLLYSSYSATVGNIKQAPYAAGNHYLEALARRRRRAGLPALAIAWGAIAETGYVVRSNLGPVLEGLGLGALRPAEAFGIAEDLLTAGAEVASAAGVDWDRLRGFFPSVSGPRFAALVPEAVGGDGMSRETLVRGLGRLSRQEAIEELTGHLTELLAGVLHMSPADIDPHGRVDGYGLDSLMGAELLVKVHNRYGIEIPPMELLRSSNSTIADIAQLVYLRLGLNADQQPPSPPRPGPDQQPPSQPEPDPEPDPRPVAQSDPEPEPHSAPHTAPPSPPRPAAGPPVGPPVPAAPPPVPAAPPSPPDRPEDPPAASAPPRPPMRRLPPQPGARQPAAAGALAGDAAPAPEGAR